MARKIKVADLLCGAGGSSTGCKRALEAMGLEMELVCLNHWPVAIDTHTRNHPEARHYIQDIATVRPHLIVPEGYLDLLMASPSCTHHSVARGGKPTSDQQRSDPWHILTWFTELRVKRAIIENVWEYTSWGPVDPRTGRPIPSRKGEYFRAWVAAIRSLGATGIEWKKLNAADYGDATTRQRFIMMIRFDRKPIVFPAPTHARRVGNLELFPGLKPWRPAREIIDWNTKGRSIFNRKKPLAPKTLARIYAGAIKFKWPEPYLVILRNHMAVQSVDGPIPTVAAHGLHIGLAQPVAKKREEAVPTFAEWFSATKNLGGSKEEYDRLYPSEPIIMNGRKGNKAQGVSVSPIPTLDTKGGVWLAEPFIATVAHGNDASERDPNWRRSKSVDDPLGAVHGTGIPYGVVQPFVLSRQSEGAPRSTNEPIPTQTAVHSPVLIAPYYGTGSGETCNSADQPLPTVTSKGRFGMVVPVTHNKGGNLARDVLDPLPTMTTAKGGEFAIVMPVTHGGGHNRSQDASGAEPLPTVTGANRGELAFVTAQFGEREGQAPRIHGLDQPASTGMTLGHGALIEPGMEYDILFRMLEPPELAAAMGFTTEDETYEFAGTKTEQVKQIGNAVSVRKMQACVAAIMADAAPKRAINPLAIAAE